MIVFFQNCSGDIKFNDSVLDSSTDSSLSENQDPGKNTDSTDPSNPSTPTSPPGGGITPPINPGPVNLGACLNFFELQGNNIIVPKKGANGFCYYIKLMNKEASHSSGSFGEITAQDVIARPHGRLDPHPFVLADTILSLSFTSSWKVALSGAHNNPNAQMLIDNFFLVEAQQQGQSIALARGTADAEPINGAISLNGQAVLDFISYAPGGTAQTSAIPLFATTPINTPMDFRFRALDCGGAAAASDVFMVFYR